MGLRLSNSTGSFCWVVWGMEREGERPAGVRPYRAYRSPEDEVGTASKDEGRITGSLKAVSLGSHDAARDGRMQADVRPHPRLCFAP